jgi:hypothetical protein
MALDAPAESVFVNGDTAFVATKSQLLPLNLKTNKPDAAIAALKTPCSNLVNAFRSTWVPNCAEAKIDRWDAKDSKLTATVPVPIAARVKPSLPQPIASGSSATRKRPYPHRSGREQDRG